jgi:hypothetical protein
MQKDLKGSIFKTKLLYAEETLYEAVFCRRRTILSLMRTEHKTFNPKDETSQKEKESYPSMQGPFMID